MNLTRSRGVTTYGRGLSNRRHIIFFVTAQVPIAVALSIKVGLTPVLIPVLLGLGIFTTIVARWAAVEGRRDYQPGPDSIPLGTVTETGARAHWWSTADSHMLITGPVGTGKTSLAQTFLNHATAHPDHWIADAITPTHELDTTNTRVSASTLEDAITLLETVNAEATSETPDHRSHLLVIDDAHEILSRANQTDKKTKALHDKANRLLHSILSSDGPVHVVLVTQRAEHIPFPLTNQIPSRTEFTSRGTANAGLHPHVRTELHIPAPQNA